MGHTPAVSFVAEKFCEVDENKVFYILSPVSLSLSSMPQFL